MAVPTHFKIVFRGRFKTTPEEWSFSTKWQRAVGLAIDGDVDNIGTSGVNAAITGFLGAGYFGQDVETTEWRAYVIGTNGKMQGEPKIVLLDPLVSGGASSPPLYPTDTALCVTTEAEDRGPGRFGRFYLPAPRRPIGSDFRLGISDTTGLLGGIETFLKAISGAIDLPDTLESSNMLNVSAVGAGSSQTVRNIRVGRVLDHIKRRRTKMLEDYQVSTTIDW